MGEHLTPVQKVACSNHVRVTCGFSDSRFETCLGCSDDSNIKKSNVNIQHAIWRTRTFKYGNVTIFSIDNRLGGSKVEHLTPVQKVACSNHVRVTCGFSDSRFETCLGCSDDSNIKKSNVNIRHAIWRTRILWSVVAQWIERPPSIPRDGCSNHAWGIGAFCPVTC